MAATWVGTAVQRVALAASAASFTSRTYVTDDIIRVSFECGTTGATIATGWTNTGITVVWTKLYTQVATGGSNTIEDWHGHVTAGGTAAVVASTSTSSGTGWLQQARGVVVAVPSATFGAFTSGNPAISASPVGALASSVYGAGFTASTVPPSPWVVDNTVGFCGFAYTPAVVTSPQAGSWGPAAPFMCVGYVSMAAVTVPGAPTALAATPGATTVGLAWTAPASNGGSAITGYSILRGTTPGSETAYDTSVGTSYTDAGVSSGTSYYYKVAATNAVGTGASSSEVTPTPSAPTGFSATAGNSQVALAWTLVDFGPAADHVEVWRGTSSGGESLLTTLGVVSSYTDTTVINGTGYFYEVREHNSQGNGPFSAEMAALPDPPFTAQLMVDLSGTPYGNSPTFTDKTPAVLAGLSFDAITVQRYRQDQYSNVTPSQLSVTFNTNDGSLTPGNTASPYYPNVRRRTRARLNFIVSGTTIPYVDTYADSWNVVPSQQVPWVSQYSGTDILARMSADSPLRGWLAEEMLLDNPNCLYPLQEAEGSTSFGDITTLLAPATVANSMLGAGQIDAGQSPSGLGLLFSDMVEITNAAYSTWTSGAAAGSWLSVPIPDLSGSTAYGFEIWVQTLPAPPAAGACLVDFGLDATGPRCTLYLNSSGVPVFAFTPTPGGSTVATIGTASICDGNAHQVAGTISGTFANLYVDGALITSSVITSVAGSPAMAARIGMEVLGSVPTMPLSAMVAYFAAYLQVPTTLRMLAHFNAGTAFQNSGSNRTDQRIAKLLTYRPDLGTNLDAGLGFMGQQDISEGDTNALYDGAGETLTQALFDAGDVEGGVVYADGLGRIAMRSRAHNFNPSPVLTLDCSSTYVTLATNFRDDIQGMVNDDTESRTGGADNRYYDSASVTLDGVAARTNTLAIDTDSNALQTAAWNVYVGKQEQLLIPGLTIDLLQLAAVSLTLLAQVLNLKPLDCIALTNIDTVATRAPSTSMTVQYQGDTLSYAVDAQTMALNCTPLPPPVGVWDSAVTAFKWDGASAVWAY